MIDPDPIDPPAWMFNYAALVDELVDNFGAYDLEGDAEDSLGELRMRDSDQVRKYIIRFNSLAANVNWDDRALRWAFKKGLAPRVRDELAQMDEPNSLLKLRREVMKIDNRYWKRIMEKRREDGKGKNSASNTNNSKKQTSTESSSMNTSKPATSSTSNQNQSSQGDS